jgi:hypothetical protein
VVQLVLAQPLILGTLLLVALKTGTDVLGARPAHAADPPASPVTAKPGAGSG